MRVTALVRSALDIYSGRPLPRVAAPALLALGAWLLAAGAATGSALGALPLLLLAWANHPRFTRTVVELFDRQAWLVLAIPLAALAVRAALPAPWASDDLLRHLAQAFWPDGYRGMYVHSALPPVELYPAFDWLAGGLARTLGPFPAMWTMQALAWIAFVAVFVAAAHRTLGGASDAQARTLTLVALTVVLVVMSQRLFLARPEVFLTAWAIAALIPSGLGGAVVWAAVGLVLSTGYWLAALYFPAALVLAIPIRGRAIVFVSLCAAWAALWWWLADGEPWTAIAWTLDQVANRIPGIAVSENRPILNLLFAPAMLALVLAGVWAWRMPEANRAVLALAGFFVASAQARYGTVIAPLLALFVLGALRGRGVRLPAGAPIVAVLIASAVFAQLATTFPRMAAQPRFHLPDGAVVLTGFDAASFATLIANPGRVRIAPAFEIGAAARPVQELVFGLAQGRIDCARVRSLGFTHLIERSLRGRPPECLSLESTQAGWRLWMLVE